MRHAHQRRGDRERRDGVAILVEDRHAQSLGLEVFAAGVLADYDRVVKQRTALLTEAAQNLAGRLLPALAALPEEDNGLLRDGMTDADFAAFLALLNAL